ncbi:hypothetical protein JTB14_009900 [Gonioctena quinquepunctata]|nr:hypothetical protein JTB14_009900 [Gonioctena quinquepunctata]
MPTKMVRVITPYPNSYTDKSSHGIYIYDLRHKYEESNAPIAPLMPKYCSRRCQNRHIMSECQQNLKCPFCEGGHESAECTKITDPKCPNCQGTHPTFYMKCPNRQEKPKNPLHTAPTLPPKDLQPLPEHISHTSREYSLIHKSTFTIIVRLDMHSHTII